MYADNVVNQLLAKIEGVNALNNILIIGMTNRKELIDDALLRPGRIGIHIEVGLPDREGRVQILQIHTSALAEHGVLATDVNLSALADGTKNFTGAELSMCISVYVCEQMRACLSSVFGYV